jgi:hypothetical protein
VVEQAEADAQQSVCLSAPVIEFKRSSEGGSDLKQGFCLDQTCSKIPFEIPGKLTYWAFQKKDQVALSRRIEKIALILPIDWHFTGLVPYTGILTMFCK